MSGQTRRNTGSGWKRYPIGPWAIPARPTAFEWLDLATTPAAQLGMEPLSGYGTSLINGGRVGIQPVRKRAYIAARTGFHSTQTRIRGEAAVVSGFVCWWWSAAMLLLFLGRRARRVCSRLWMTAAMSAASVWAARPNARQNVSETVKKHVNENIAHYNPSKAEDLGLTYGHIHEAADTICRIYQDLHTIIDDATVVPPSVADSSPYFAWEFLFTEAWVTHDKAHDIAQRRLDEWQRLTPSVSMSPRLIVPSGPLRPS